METKQKIRPASRHLFTIGEDLIQDKYAAVVELVKNAYDADASKVELTFDNTISDYLVVEINDNGHGMSLSDIKNKWLVPSTSNKQYQKVSPKGRVMQGRKGIGRYAVNILGSFLTLETVDNAGELSKIEIDWQRFNEYEYLDEVEILITTQKVDSESGTRLSIKHKKAPALDEDDTFWSIEDIEHLNFELKKLLPPQDDLDSPEFDIIIKTRGYFEKPEEELNEKVKIFSIREFYDYRISGKILANGQASLIYENARDTKIVEHIEIQYDSTDCGTVEIDIRVFDRDKEGIDSLVSNLENSSPKHFVSRLEAKRLLNLVNGVGVYRNGFRIRPLGNPDNDWLKLDSQRVQNPSQKIGSNQVIGYVHIESEEQSGLVEKSARDGLKNDRHYKALVRLTKKIISELENRRYSYRRKTDNKKKNETTRKQIEVLIDSSNISKKVNSMLENIGIDEVHRKEIVVEISKDEESKKELVEELSKTIATYQGQATLGKIVHIIMHEGRRPLNYFINQVPNLSYFTKKFIDTPTDNSREKIENLSKNIVSQTKIFSTLFKKLNPLANKRASKKKEFKLSDTIEASLNIFETEIRSKSIKTRIYGDKSVEVYGWYEDFITIFTNLIENSIYWMNEGNSEIKKIEVIIGKVDGNVRVDLFDSGPGIQGYLIENKDIFEPDFSTKQEGSGLGLPIAGEAADRNNFILEAVESEVGAHFRLKYKGE